MLFKCSLQSQKLSFRSFNQLQLFVHPECLHQAVHYIRGGFVGFGQTPPPTGRIDSLCHVHLVYLLSCVNIVTRLAHTIYMYMWRTMAAYFEYVLKTFLKGSFHEVVSDARLSYIQGHLVCSLKKTALWNGSSEQWNHPFAFLSTSAPRLTHQYAPDTLEKKARNSWESIPPIPPEDALCTNITTCCTTHT